MLIFAKSLILLLPPAEALRPEQPNKRVRHAQRKCRASLQTVPGVPSLHPVHDGQACSDGAPSILCPWQNALSRRTAPQFLKRHHGHPKAPPRRHQGIPGGVPSQLPQGQLTVLFSLWNCEPDGARQAKVPSKKARASGPDQIPPRVARSFVGCLAVGQSFAVLCSAPNIQRRTS